MVGTDRDRKDADDRRSAAPTTSRCGAPPRLAALMAPYRIGDSVGDQRTAGHTTST